MSRPLSLGCFAVDDQSLYVADDTFPVIAQLDRRTGSLQRLFGWEVSDELRRESVSKAIARHADEILVSSPSAGGLVRIDLASAHTALVPLDELPSRIIVVGETVWVISDPDSDPDWDALDADAPPVPAANALPSRPVVWAGPHGRDPDWDDDIDDFSWDAPRPVWRIDGDRAERVDLGGDVTQLLPISHDSFLFVVRRADDPVVKTWSGDGGTSYDYPGALARCDAGATPTVVMDLPSIGGSLFVDGNRCWLSGFGFEAADPQGRPGVLRADPNALHELDIESGRLTRSSLVVGPDVIVGNIAISIIDRYVPGGTRRVCDARSYDLADPERPIRVELPRAVNTYFSEPVVNAGAAWFASDKHDALVWIDPTAGTAGAIPVAVDLGPHAPAPRRPEGVDLEQFEQSQFEAVRDSFESEWHDEEGNVVDSPFITNLQIESVERRGRFPDSHVVIRYRATYRPGIAFARRLNLYDELGNTESLEDADMYLSEDIDSGGAPAVEECEPDADGIVWF